MLISWSINLKVTVIETISYNLLDIVFHNSHIFTNAAVVDNVKKFVSGKSSSKPD